jgi:YVTN family beta-propeller protein
MIGGWISMYGFAGYSKVLFLAVTAAVAATVTQMIVGQQSDGSYVIPTGQTITPAGFNLTVGERPLGMALSPDGAQLALLTCSSFSGRYLQIIDLATRTVSQSFPMNGSFVGVVYSPDSQSIYASGGSEATIHVFTRGREGTFAESTPISDPSTSNMSGLSITPDGSQLFAAMNLKHGVNGYDLIAKTMRFVKTGAFPYATLVSRDGATVYVSNWGGRLASPSSPTDGHLPVIVDPKTGLPTNGTVSVVDVATFTIRAEIQVGLHPGAIALSPAGDLLYIANSNSDSVSVVDTSSNRVVRSIDVRPFPDAPPGSLPNALALSPDGTILYVANGGNNAVAVVRLGSSPAVAGFIPTGWFPSALAVSPDNGTLLVASGYGFGSVRQEPYYFRNYHFRDGELSFIPVPDPANLTASTAQVIQNNGFAQRDAPAPPLAGASSPIRHVFFIIKENRTYDQVLGDLGQGNGDPSLVVFGSATTPNHHALATQFVTLDNFYAAGDTSAMGHQFCNEAAANDYVYKYGRERNDYAGTNPMAYSSGGFLWDNARNHGKSVRVYGEFAADTVVTPPQATWSDHFLALANGTQATNILAKSRVAGLKDILAPAYPGFNLNVPDQVRVEAFLREFHQYEATGTLPNLTIIALSSDHTVGTSSGTPTPRAMMADNDLALGRIVDAISHSDDWKSSAIFVTEDDAQGGNDHVEGHRTVGFVISPWTRNRGVDSTLYSTIGMVRTIGQILGLPAMTQYDLGATAMFPAFNSQPDFTPFTALQPSISLSELNPSLAVTSGLQKDLAIASQKMDFSDADEAPEDTLNRAIWHSVKGYDKPYPQRRPAAQPSRHLLQ